MGSHSCKQHRYVELFDTGISLVWILILLAFGAITKYTKK